MNTAATIFVMIILVSVSGVGIITVIPKKLEDRARETIFGIYKHAQRGVGNEQKTAKSMLTKMLTKNEITLDDFIKEYKIYGNEKRYI